MLKNKKNISYILFYTEIVIFQNISNRILFVWNNMSDILFLYNMC